MADIPAIRAKVAADNPMGVLVDRRELLELYDAHMLAFANIVKVLVHGRSVAGDIQAAVRFAQEQLGTLPTVVNRNCTTDEDLGSGGTGEDPQGGAAAGVGTDVRG